jgi:acylphosphatase
LTIVIPSEARNPRYRLCQILRFAQDDTFVPSNGFPMTRGHQRRTVYYKGHVQGVGFRYTTHAIARGHKVTGYVCNLPDGRVEVVAESERPELDAFLSKVRERFFNYIRDERCDEGPATGEFDSFDIRH